MSCSGMLLPRISPRRCAILVAREYSLALYPLRHSPARSLSLQSAPPQRARGGGGGGGTVVCPKSPQRRRPPPLARATALVRTTVGVVSATPVCYLHTACRTQAVGECKRWMVFATLEKCIQDAVAAPSATTTGHIHTSQPSQRIRPRKRVWQVPEITKSKLIALSPPPPLCPPPPSPSEGRSPPIPIPRPCAKPPHPHLRGGGGLSPSDGDGHHCRSNTYQPYNMSSFLMISLFVHPPVPIARLPRLSAHVAVCDTWHITIDRWPADAFERCICVYPPPPCLSDGLV